MKTQQIARFNLNDGKFKNNSSDISFEGLNIQKMLVVSKKNHPPIKLKRFNDELVDILRQFFINVMKKDKMPFSTKPLIAPEDLEDLESLAKAGNKAAYATLDVAKKLLNNGIINRSSDVFTSGGEIKAEAAEKLSKSIILRAQAHATDNIHISDKMAPKSAKGLLDDILSHVEDNNYTNSLLKDQSKYLDDIANNKLNHLSADFNYAPGDRTSIAYQTQKYYDNELDRLHDRQIQGKTINNMNSRELNEDMIKLDQERMDLLLEHPELAKNDSLFLKQHPDVARQIIEKHPEYTNEIMQQNPDLFSKTIGETVSDKIKGVGDNIKENLEGLKGAVAEKLGFNQADDISQHLDKVSFGANNLKTMDDGQTVLNGLSEIVEKPNVFNVVSDRPAFSGTIIESPAVGSELAEVIAEAGEKHEIASGLLDNLSNIAEKLSDVPGLEEAAEALVVVKFLPAIKHLANEEYEEALVKGGTRLAETVALPAKWAKMAAGAIKGVYLKASRISSDGAGAFKGAKQAMRRWNKGRKELEDDILGIPKLSPAEILEKKQKALENAKQKAIDKVNAKAQQELDNLNYNVNQQLQAIDANTEIVKESAAFDMKKVQYLKSNIEETERQVNSELENIKIKLDELLLEKESIANKHIIKVEDFSKQIEDAKQKEDLKLQKSLEFKLQDIQKDFLEKSEALVLRINQFRQRVDLYAKLDSISSARGFNKIAGYNKQKKILIEHFETLINKEKAGENVDIPGAILFFGPKGNGKTTFARAFAEELNCHPVKLMTTLSPEQDYFKIQEAAIEAEKYYQRTGTRTILLIDEFDIFAHKTGNSTNKLKSLIEKISKEYHCTIFATTNAPEDVAVELLKGKIFYKAGLAPANKSNAMSILKHYAGSFVNESVDFNSLANDIVKTQPNEAYSNARISNIIKTLLKDEKNIGRKLTQEDLKQAIEDKGPDIKNEALELFTTQLKYCRDLTDNSHTDIKIVKEIPVPEEISIGYNNKDELNYLQESAAKTLDSYSEKLISGLELPNRQFARSVFPELSSIISDSDELKEILKLITPENKGFVVNQALPIILKNVESLDLEHSIASTLRASTPDNIDCLEKFADSIELYNIKNSNDVIILLSSITKENKDFAFNELFPYLAENAENYKIIRGGQMAEYLDATTPKNKEFMFNEAIPSILECADALMLNASDIATIAKHLNRENIESLKFITENNSKFDIYGKWNQLDINKLVGYLNKSTQELSEKI